MRLHQIKLKRYLIVLNIIIALIEENKKDYCSNV